jgi:hypothetical protein
MMKNLGILSIIKRKERSEESGRKGKFKHNNIFELFEF